MKKNWFTQLFPDYLSITHSSNNKFKKYLRYSYLWHLDRESVARGVAIGIFIGIVPIIPFQTLLAIFLSIFLRGNFPVAFITSWISNPITFIPILYLIYYVGDLVLGKNGGVVVQDVTLKFSNFSVFWSSFSAWFYQFGKAFFVGLPIVSIGAAIIGYLMVTLIWHVTVFFKDKNKSDHLK